MTELPLYEQVRQSLADSIDSGEYGPGDKLPGESTIAAMMGVNRLTVRRAIEELARAGRVQSRQGSGTYVTHSVTRLPVSQSLSTDSLVSGITEQLAEHGHSYEDVLIKATRVNQPQANIEFGLPPGHSGASTTPLSSTEKRGCGRVHGCRRSSSRTLAGSGAR